MKSNNIQGPGMFNIPLVIDLPHLGVEKYKTFCRTPNNPTCKVVNANNIKTSILLNGKEFSPYQITPDITSQQKVNPDGNGYIAFHYRSSKGRTDKIATILGFQYEKGEIWIRQLQGQQNKISFQFHSSFDEVKGFLYILEETFFKNGISVNFNKNDIANQFHSYGLSEGTIKKYNRLITGIQNLRLHYGYEKTQNNKKTLEEIKRKINSQLSFKTKIHPCDVLDLLEEFPEQKKQIVIFLLEEYEHRAYFTNPTENRLKYLLSNL